MLNSECWSLIITLKVCRKKKKQHMQLAESPHGRHFLCLLHYWGNMFNDNLICCHILKAFWGKECLLIGQFISKFQKYHTSCLILEIELKGVHNCVDNKSLGSLGDVERCWGDKSDPISKIDAASAAVAAVQCAYISVLVIPTFKRR